MKEFHFGPEAIVYIREQLAKGLTLASYLLRLPLEEGVVRAYLPDTASEEAAQNFREGGVREGIFLDELASYMALPKEEEDDSLTTLILEHLAKSDAPLVVFEDAAGSPEFPAWQSPKHQYFIFNSEVYHFLNPQDVDLRRIHRTIWTAHVYPFIGILTSRSTAEQEIGDRQKVTADTLEKLANRTRHLVIGAYDLEGELIWSRTDQ